MDITFKIKSYMQKHSEKSDISELSHAEKNLVIAMLQEQVLLLTEKYKRLEARFKDLEGKSKKNSRNSSKPPSSDFNQKKTTSSKKKSEKKPGGQPGHKGNTLEIVKKPDEIIRLEVSNCDNCGNNLKNSKSDIDRRQEFEIPEPKMWITEYQAESKDCSCGYTTKACFPEWITHVTQYGPRAKSLMVYMNQYQFIPYDRASQFFGAVYGQKVSPGTIVNAVATLGNRLDHLDKEIKSALTKDKLVNCDETSMSVNGTKQWLHTVGTENLAHYALHEKRGKEATKDIGILPEFKGIMVHDHWKSYFSYENNEHALCNAHHLRELRFINENHNMKWAATMSALLIKINEHKGKYIEKGNSSFSNWLVKKYDIEYNNILDKARKEQSRRGTLDSHNLIKRLTNYKTEVLLFMNNFIVPFTNNLSEQDLRMAKVKQKISGCFRNVASGDSFCKIRSMLISAKKNQKNIFNTIQKAFRKKISINDLLAA